MQAPVPSRRSSLISRRPTRPGRLPRPPRRPTACKKDTDCKCFNGLDAAVLCGGVIDAKTALELGALQKDFYAKSCRRLHTCAAQMCDPGCEEGHRVMAKKR